MADKKEFKDMDPKDLKIQFAPGCFDNFDGTQEELDKLIEDITAMVASGELQDNSTELTEEEWDELPDEVKVQLMQAFESDEEYDHDWDDAIDQIGDARKRRLQ